MKTIKIFLASSEELEDDRNAFGNLVRKLNKTYEKRGIHLELFEWEDYDAAYNDRRKQDEYNDEVRASDMFLAVFHRVAGKFTIEEFDVATEEFRKKGLPKSYVYCKDLKDGDVESEELKKFKKRLFEEMGHYWSRYTNRDTMQLHFVMQLQLIESSGSDALKVEDGTVVLDGQPIARMENLPFAGLNEDFQKMSARLTELPIKIEKARAKTEKYPDDKDFQDELQALLDEYNKLKEDFAEYQNNLFATAKRIAQLQGERITDRMRRAMEAFNEGRVRDANIILNEAERDGEIALQEYKRSKELTEQKRQNVINSIEEILLKTSTTMADLSIPIDKRIAKTEELYAQADTMAQECDYEKEQYEKLLFDYADFLRYYAILEKATEISQKLLDYCKSFKIDKSIIIANAHHLMGLILDDKRLFNDALLHYNKALSIRNEILPSAHTDIATSYNDIGTVYLVQGKCNDAMDMFTKALHIRKQLLGIKSIEYIQTTRNIGAVYLKTNNFDEAAKTFFQTYWLCLHNLGKNHIETALSLEWLSQIYRTKRHMLSTAIEYSIKALNIYEYTLGTQHLYTAGINKTIGELYAEQGNYPEAINRFHLSLNVFKKYYTSKDPLLVEIQESIDLIQTLADENIDLGSILDKAYINKIKNAGCDIGLIPMRARKDLLKD